MLSASLAVTEAWMFNFVEHRTKRDALLTVIVDERNADSRAFALRARMAGARVMPLCDEIGALWFDRLMPLATSHGNVLAGLTTHADAFLLTRFALENGLAITRRAAGENALVAWRIERAS